jgi:hypothetical protein
MIKKKKNNHNNMLQNMLQKNKKINNYNKLKKIFFLVLVVFVFSFFGADKINASGNVYGWAWTENIGWINFNHLGTIDHNGTAVPGDEGSVDFGVHICESDTDPNPNCSGIATPKIGKIVGYAWSENIGWINFNPTPDLTTYPNCGFPTLPCNSAKVDLSEAETNYPVTGWARACSVFQTGCSGNLDNNRGGWDGWIELHNLYIDTSVSPAEFHMWVWGGNPDNDVNKSVIGWGTFNCYEGSTTGTPFCTVNGGHDYKVVTYFPFTPPVLPPEVTQVGSDDPLSSNPLTYLTFHPDWCSEDIYFGWTYVDNNTPSSPEKRYQFQVDDNSDFILPEINIDQTLSPPRASPTVNNRTIKVSATPIGEQLAYNTTYYWRVKVYDNTGLDSGWQGGNFTSTSFTTPKHHYPIASFSYTPPSPQTIVNNSITFDFTDKSTCYDDNNQPLPSCTKFNWTFEGGGTTTNPNSSTPSHTYDSIGTKNVTLTVEDNHIPLPYSCTTSQDIKINPPKKTPKWWEISPFW